MVCIWPIREIRRDHSMRWPDFCKADILSYWNGIDGRVLSRLTIECSGAGRHLSQLPVDAGVGKLLVLGAALGCLSTCLTVAACLSYRTPFASSQDQQDAAGRVRQAMAATGLPSAPRTPATVVA